jgi:hypothetical protein
VSSSTRTSALPDPEFEREGDFTDKDVTAADTDTEPRSFTAKDVD